MCPKDGDSNERDYIRLRMHGTTVAHDVFGTFEQYFEEFVHSLAGESFKQTRQRTSRARIASPKQVRDLLCAATASKPFYQDAMEAYLISDDPTRLMRCIMINDEETIRHLLGQAGVDVNAKSSDGISALHVAALVNNVRITQILLNNGGDLNVTTKYGETPLHIASFYGNCQVFQLLLNSGANPQLLCSRGETCVFYAAAFNHMCILHLLHGVHVDLDAGRRDYWTPLHVAALHGHVEASRLLVENCVYSHAEQVDVYTGRRGGRLMPSEIARDQEMARVSLAGRAGSDAAAECGSGFKVDGLQQR